MLAAMMLLGLLPLAALPMVMDKSSDPADDLPPDEATDVNDDAFDAGDVHELDGIPGEMEFDGFAPDLDLIEVDLTAVEGDVHYDVGHIDGTAMASFSVADNAAVTLKFPELEDVPTGDIVLKLSDPGSEPFELALSDALKAHPSILVKPGDVAAPPLDPDHAEIDDTKAPEDSGPIVTPEEAETADRVPASHDGPPAAPGDPDETAALSRLLDRDGSGADAAHALAAAAQSGVEDVTLGPDDDTAVLGRDGTAKAEIDATRGIPALDAAEGVAVVDAGDGDDSVWLAEKAGHVFGGDGNDTLAAGATVAALYGGAGGDVLAADTARSYQDGGAGNDVLGGGLASDTLLGGEGNDSLYGDEGDDYIDGGAGADSLMAGDGDDHLFVGSGDTAAGGAGADTFEVSSELETGEIPIVEDFEIGTDMLHLALPRDTYGEDEPTIRVERSADGENGLVTVNDAVVAMVKGAPGMGLGDIFVDRGA